MIFGLNYAYWEFWSRSGCINVMYVCQVDYLPRKFTRWSEMTWNPSSY